MKRAYLFILYFFFFAIISRAQSFYLNSPTSLPKCKFSNDAIYFFGGSDLIKTDYDGNVIWSKHSNPFTRMVVEEASIYGIGGNTIIKIDTAGNFIWARDLSQPIYSGNPNPTYLTDVFIDGSRVYIPMTQNPSYPLPPVPQFSRAVVVLDTAGTLLDVVGDSISSFDRSEIGCKSLVNGGWVSFYDMQGAFHGYFITHIDSTGNYFIGTIGGGGNESHVQDISPMTDSSYLVVVNLQQTNGGIFSCAKINENGNTLWDTEYSDQNNQCVVYYSATDSLNNIYLLGYAWMSFNNSGPFLVKLDPGGNVISSKAWSHYNPAFQFVDQLFMTPQIGVNGMKYREGHLYCVGKYDTGIWNPSILVFDSLLNNPCYGPDSNIVITKGNTFSGAGLTMSGMQPYFYLPTNTTINLPNAANPNVNDLCNALSAANVIENVSGVISPNPFHTTATFEIKNKKSGSQNCYLKIYNTIGTCVRNVSVIINSGKAQIDREELNNGLYFYELISENYELLANGKFVVE